MSAPLTPIWRCLSVLVAGSIVLAAHAAPQEQVPADAAQLPDEVAVDGEVALHALMALSDGHLEKIADLYAVVATMQPVRSGEWQHIAQPLAEAASVSVPALHWFALPDGSYWMLEEGKAEGNLADRPYFARVLAGERVIGELVVSRATGKSVAIVAVPVYGHDQRVVGVLGASVYLEQLSRHINEEMNLAANQIFYSLDSTPIVGLHKDPQTIFVYPLQEGDPQLEAAIREILSRDEGAVSYRFRGQGRTVYYRRSPVTGWWYAFGVVEK